MRVLGLDFETTGLEPGSERVIEVGAVVWSTDSKRPLCTMSELVLPDPEIQLSAEITQITGIETEDLQQFGQAPEPVFSRLNEWMGECEYIVAHNAPFDRAFYLSEIEHLNLHAVDKPWIDTLVDLPLPSHLTSRKLNHLAADHGLVNPFSHRAVFDVMTMLQLMGRYNFSEIQERQKSPQLEVVAHVSYDEREQAKKQGFRWQPDRKVWAKNLKACDLETSRFPFEYSQTEV